MSVSKRVDRGATLLDRKKSNWHDKIDIDSLDIQSSADCILGQLYYYYLNGAEQVGLTPGLGTVRYGFELSLWERRSQRSEQRASENLKEAWINEINARRSE